jgi:lipoprotein signal peptidase
MYISDSKGALPYTAISVWISSGYSFQCFKFFRISQLKVCIHTLEKIFFLLYIKLPMILQLGGLGNLIDGIATAVSAAHNFVDEESVKGKSSIWYQ